MENENGVDVFDLLMTALQIVAGAMTVGAFKIHGHSTVVAALLGIPTGIFAAWCIGLGIMVSIETLWNVFRAFRRWEWRRRIK